MIILKRAAPDVAGGAQVSFTGWTEKSTLSALPKKATASKGLPTAWSGNTTAVLADHHEG
jgi:hypothetical protein